PQTAQRLAEARRELDARRSGKQQPQSKEGALDKAQSLQEETKNTIDELVRSLDPWANIHQVKSQAREILEKQREVEQATRKLEDKGNRATREEINQTAKAQENLAERLQELLDKMKQAGDKRAEQGDKQTAQRLQEAIQ